MKNISNNIKASQKGLAALGLLIVLVGLMTASLVAARYIRSVNADGPVSISFGGCSGDSRTAYLTWSPNPNQNALWIWWDGQVRDTANLNSGTSGWQLTVPANKQIDVTVGFFDMVNFTQYNSGSSFSPSCTPTPTPTPQVSLPTNLVVSGEPSCASGPYSVTLGWSNSGSGWYVDISTDPNFGSISNKNVSGLTSTTAAGGFSPSITLNPGVAYYWRIWNGSTHTYSRDWGQDFLVYPCATPTPTQPPTPTPTSQPQPIPAQLAGITQASCNADGTRPVRFGWNRATGGTIEREFLDLDLASDQFREGEYVGNDVKNLASPPIFQTNLQGGITFWWRVNSYVNGQWWPSNPKQETVQPCAPTEAPAIGVAYSQACYVSSYSATLYWNEVPGATGYILRIDDGVNPPDGRDVGNVTSFLITGRQVDVVYYWAVSAYNDGGDGPGSEISSIHRESCVAPTPTPTPPGGGGPTPTPTSAPTPTQAQFQPPITSGESGLICEPTSGTWAITFNWTPGYLPDGGGGIAAYSDSQWLDIKFDDGKPWTGADGTDNFYSFGPLNSGQASMSLPGIVANQPHKWRVTNLYQSQWYWSADDFFKTDSCGGGGQPTPTPIATLTPTPTPLPQDCTNPGSFRLVGPTPETIFDQPSFYWTSSLNVDRYFLDLSQDPNFDWWWYVPVAADSISQSTGNVVWNWAPNWTPSGVGAPLPPNSLAEGQSYYWRVSAWPKNCPDPENNLTLAGPVPFVYRQVPVGPRQINPATLTHVTNTDQSVSQFFPETINTTFNWTPSDNSRDGDVQQLYLKFADDNQGAPNRSNSIHIPPTPFDKYVNGVTVGDQFFPGLASDKDHFWTVDTFDPSVDYKASLANPDAFKTISAGVGITPTPTIIPGTENCDNGADDDGDGQIDHNDSNCPPGQVQVPRVTNYEGGNPIFSWNSLVNTSDYWLDVSTDSQFRNWYGCNTTLTSLTWDGLGCISFENGQANLDVLIPSPLDPGNYSWRVVAHNDVDFGIPVHGPVFTVPQTASNIGVIILSQSCSGGDSFNPSPHWDVQTAYTGDATDPAGRFYWVTLTDTVTGQTNFISALRTFGGTSTFHGFAGSLRSSEQMTLVADGRYYIVRVYLAPYTEGVPVLGQPVYERSFLSETICDSTPIPIPTILPVPTMLLEITCVSPGSFRATWPRPSDQAVAYDVFFGEQPDAWLITGRVSSSLSQVVYDGTHPPDTITRYMQVQALDSSGNPITRSQVEPYNCPPGPTPIPEPFVASPAVLLGVEQKSCLTGGQQRQINFNWIKGYTSNSLPIEAQWLDLSADGSFDQGHFIRTSSPPSVNDASYLTGTGSISHLTVNQAYSWRINTHFVGDVDQNGDWIWHPSNVANTFIEECVPTPGEGGNFSISIEPTSNSIEASGGSTADYVLKFSYDSFWGRAIVLQPNSASEIAPGVSIRYEGDSNIVQARDPEVSVTLVATDQSKIGDYDFTVRGCDIDESLCRDARATITVVDPPPPPPPIPHGNLPSDVDSIRAAAAVRGLGKLDGFSGYPLDRVLWGLLDGESGGGYHNAVGPGGEVGIFQYFAYIWDGYGLAWVDSGSAVPNRPGWKTPGRDSDDYENYFRNHPNPEARPPYVDANAWDPYNQIEATASWLERNTSKAVCTRWTPYAYRISLIEIDLKYPPKQRCGSSSEFHPKRILGKIFELVAKPVDAQGFNTNTTYAKPKNVFQKVIDSINNFFAGLTAKITGVDVREDAKQTSTTTTSEVTNLSLTSALDQNDQTIAPTQLPTSTVTAATPGTSQSFVCEVNKKKKTPEECLKALPTPTPSPQEVANKRTILQKIVDAAVSTVDKVRGKKSYKYVDYHPRGYIEARNKVMPFVPYFKDGVKFEYLSKSDQFLGTVVNPANVDDFRSKKKAVEDYLKSKTDANLCNLAIFWTGPKEVVSQLQVQDSITTGCAGS